MGVAGGIVMGGRGNNSDRSSSKFGGTDGGSGDIKIAGGGLVEGFGKAEQALARKMFGKNVSAQEIANMSGAAAFGGANVEVGIRAGKLEINISHKSIDEKEGGMVRSIYQDKSGKTAIKNEAFFLNKSAQGQGLGAKSLASQAKAAQSVGAARLTTFALTDGRGSVGHKVWADLGYNGRLSKEIVNQWKQSNPLEAIRGIKPPRTIHELYDRNGGRSFWARRGESQKMVFRLDRGSKSVKKLNAYITAKGYKI